MPLLENITKSIGIGSSTSARKVLISIILTHSSNLVNDPTNESSKVKMHKLNNTCIVAMTIIKSKIVFTFWNWSIQYINDSSIWKRNATLKRRIQSFKNKKKDKFTTDKKKINVAKTTVKVNLNVKTLIAIDALENLIIEDDPFIDNINIYLASSVKSNKASQVYNWLADLDSIHHITNWCEFF